MATYTKEEVVADESQVHLERPMDHFDHTLHPGRRV